MKTARRHISPEAPSVSKEKENGDRGEESTKNAAKHRYANARARKHTHTQTHANTRTRTRTRKKCKEQTWHFAWLCLTRCSFSLSYTSLPWTFSTVLHLATSHKALCRQVGVKKRNGRRRRRRGVGGKGEQQEQEHVLCSCSIHMHAWHTQGQRTSSVESTMRWYRSCGWPL